MRPMFTVWDGFLGHSGPPHDPKTATDATSSR
jgi:hypothetical protein